MSDDHRASIPDGHKCRCGRPATTRGANGHYFDCDACSNFDQRLRAVRWAATNTDRSLVDQVLADFRENPPMFGEDDSRRFCQEAAWLDFARALRRLRETAHTGSPDVVAEWAREELHLHRSDAEVDERRPLIARAVRRAESDTSLVAWVLAKHRQSSDLDMKAQAKHLGVSNDALLLLALCRRPVSSGATFIQAMHHPTTCIGCSRNRLDELLGDSPARATHPKRKKQPGANAAPKTYSKYRPQDLVVRTVGGHSTSQTTLRGRTDKRSRPTELAPAASMTRTQPGPYSPAQTRSVDGKRAGPRQVLRPAQEGSTRRAPEPPRKPMTVEEQARYVAEVRRSSEHGQREQRDGQSIHGKL